jgi:hypothetical protein
MALGGILHRPMSEEARSPNVIGETRRLFALARDRDLDSIFDSFAADAVWDMSRPTGRVDMGLATIRGSISAWLKSYDRWEIGLEDILEFSGGVVLINAYLTVYLPGSGNVEWWPGVLVCEWRDGLVVRVTIYADGFEARSAAEHVAAERAACSHSRRGVETHHVHSRPAKAKKIMTGARAAISSDDHQ